MDTLKLAAYDSNIQIEQVNDYLSTANAGMAVSAEHKSEFRSDYGWNAPMIVQDSQVTNLQSKLKTALISLQSDKQGILGYQTEASIRVFQEYVRTAIPKENIGHADGIYGSQTAVALSKPNWQNAPIPWVHQDESPEAEALIRMLFTWKMECGKNPPSYVQSVANFGKSCDTLVASKWNFAPGNIHLVGIRNQASSAMNPTNKDEDLFLLIVNGKVFKFWGSTSPNLEYVSNPEGAPFLVEGQHRYRLGWHKIADENRIYRALVPYESGVLINRKKGGQATKLSGPNRTIHIHWSGLGISNWSAGCQVIAGSSYINPDGDCIDYSKLAARTYRDLSPTKSRGAYQIMLDLIQLFSKNINTEVFFTLISKETFQKYAQNEDAITWQVQDQLSLLKKSL